MSGGTVQSLHKVRWFRQRDSLPPVISIKFPNLPWHKCKIRSLWDLSNRQDSICEKYDTSNSKGNSNSYKNCSKDAKLFWVLRIAECLQFPPQRLFQTQRQERSQQHWQCHHDGCGPEWKFHPFWSLPLNRTIVTQIDPHYHGSVHQVVGHWDPSQELHGTSGEEPCSHGLSSIQAQSDNDHQLGVAGSQLQYRARLVNCCCLCSRSTEKFRNGSFHMTERKFEDGMKCDEDDELTDVVAHVDVHPPPPWFLIFWYFSHLLVWWIFGRWPGKMIIPHKCWKTAAFAAIKICKDRKDLYLVLSSPAFSILYSLTVKSIHIPSSYSVAYEPCTNSYEEHRQSCYWPCCYQPIACFSIKT